MCAVEAAQSVFLCGDRPSSAPRSVDWVIRERIQQSGPPFWRLGRPTVPGLWTVHAQGCSVRPAPTGVPRTFVPSSFVICP